MRIFCLLVLAGALFIVCTEEQSTSTKGSLPSDREHKADTVFIDSITTSVPLSTSTSTLSE